MNFAKVTLCTLLFTSLMAVFAAAQNLRPQGAYGFTVQGNILPPDGGNINAVSVGRIVFEESDECTFDISLNAGGNFAEDLSAIECTYQVDTSTGIGKITLITNPDELAPGFIELKFVTVDNSKQLRFVRTDIGVALGVAVRQ